MKDIIKSANAPVQDIVDALQTIMSAFALDTANEAMLAQHYYETRIRSSHDRAALVALRELKSREHEKLAERRDGILAYQDFLKRISGGHQLLFDDAEGLANEEMPPRVEAYLRGLKASYRTLE